jgi:hypothetical protein
MRNRGLLGMSANQPVEAAGGGSDIELAPELREQLEALGYQR